MNNTPGSVNERVAVVENKLETITLRLESVSIDIKVISTSIEKILTQKIAGDTRLNMELENLKEEVKGLKMKSGMWIFMTPTLSAIIGSILTFLIIFYFQHINSP